MSDADRVELEFWGVKLKMPNKRASEVIAVLSLIATILVAVGGWLFYTDSKAADQRSVANQEKILKATKDGNEKNEMLQRGMYRVLVESACLQRFDPKDRERKVQFCKDMARTANP